MLKKNFTRLSVCVLSSVFTGASITANAATLAVIHDFMSSDGAAAVSGLIKGSDGNFYGTTSAGGNLVAGGNGYGVVFRMTPAGAVTVLHQFSGGDGAYPESALLLASDGNFYGTTRGLGGTGSGGSGAQGTVFKISSAGTFTVLYRFSGSGNNYPHGGSPYGTLIQGANGSLYGTTEGGGANSAGTIFKITTSGVLTTLYSFTAGPTNADGANPIGGLAVANGGNYFGVTSSGGTNGCGEFFKISPSGVFAAVHSMGNTEACGHETTLAKDSSGNFYGASLSGGTGAGVAFKITPTGIFTALHSFNGTDGSDPSGLVLGSDGYLYGTTYAGGTAGLGTVYRVSTAGVFTSLFSATASYGIESPLPLGAMVEDSNGIYYGTSQSGGSAGDGTVFKFKP